VDGELVAMDRQEIQKISRLKTCMPDFWFLHFFSHSLLPMSVLYIV
jgi:hypothetical protein